MFRNPYGVGGAGLVVALVSVFFLHLRGMVDGWMAIGVVFIYLLLFTAVIGMTDKKQKPAYPPEPKEIYHPGMYLYDVAILYALDGQESSWSTLRDQMRLMPSDNQSLVQPLTRLLENQYVYTTGAGLQQVFGLSQAGQNWVREHPVVRQ